jgi:predicted RND superfamily exporter protein
MSIKATAERGLERWASITVRARWILIPAMLGLALAFGSQLPKLTTDTSSENYLKPGDPDRVTYDSFREQFGRDTKIAIGIDPPEVFDLAFLERLREFHQALEADVPLLEEVTSLVNIRNTRGEDDRLIVEDLLEDFPETKDELATLKARVMSNPLYQDYVISRDGSFTSIIVETQAYSSLGVADDALSGFDEEENLSESEPPAFLTGEENAKIVHAIYEVAERFEAPDFRTYITGSPIMTEYLQDRIREDMAKFMAVALVVIAAFLFALLRRLAGVVLPLLVVILSLITILGIMAMAGIPITIPTQILPSFLLSVGVGYAVHILVIFLQHYDAGASREEALVHALGHSGIPIIMSALTTSAGMLSFMTAELDQIATFGIVAPTGVAVSLLYTLVLLPALIAVFPIRRRQRSRDASRMSRTDRVLQGVGGTCSRNPWKVTFVSIGLAVVAIAGAVRVQVSHNPMEWFKDDSIVKIASNTIDERLGGTLPMEVLIDTRIENGIQEPAVLNLIDEMHQRVDRFIADGSKIGKAVSIADVLRETHQALNENRSEFYTIPQDRKVVAQELLLFENSGSDDLEDVVDTSFSLTRFTLRMPDGEAYDRADFILEAASEFVRIMGDSAQVTITGLSVIMNRTMSAVVHSLMRSYILALLLITPLMMLFIGSIRRGLVSMVPNLLPILLTLGFMGWTGIPLDIFTLLIGCIAIGLAVDDTIHFIHGFQRNWEQHGDSGRAISQTLETTGKALLFTTLVLSAGFFIFTLSSLNNLIAFGLLTGFAILMAFISDVTVTPALLTLVSRSRTPATVSRADSGQAVIEQIPETP